MQNRHQNPKLHLYNANLCLFVSFGWAGNVGEGKAQSLQGALADSGGILGCLISKKSRLWKVKAATEMIEKSNSIKYRSQNTGGYSWMQLDRTVSLYGSLGRICGGWMFVIKTGDKPTTPNTRGLPHLMTRLNARLQPWHLHRGPLRILSRWSPVSRSAPVTWHSSQQPED